MGPPQAPRSENVLTAECGKESGPEFANRYFLAWCAERKIEVVHIEPGKPVQNAHVESFYGKLRDERLHAHWFTTLTEARQVIEAWRREYNESRPHRALGERTPNEFACQDAANRALMGVKTAVD